MTAAAFSKTRSDLHEREFKHLDALHKVLTRRDCISELVQQDTGKCERYKECMHRGACE